MKSVAIVLLLFFTSMAFSQLENVCRLPKELDECSGMLFLNDSTLLLHNDSERPNRLYAINLKGKLLDIIELPVYLRDFEAITAKGNLLYLGDIGNNSNNRKDLKIAVFDLKNKKIISLDTIHYPEQRLFPPSSDSLYFDAEAMAFKNDSLLIFTKNRTKPYDGKSLVYYFNESTGKLEQAGEIITGTKGWLTNSVTDAVYHKEKLYLLTYKFLYIFDAHFQLKEKIKFPGISQKEAIAINTEGVIYIATEKHPVLGGGKLYKLKKK